MGVITRVECGSEVNDGVARCPECGADPRRGSTDEERAAAARRGPVEPVEQARLARERGQQFLEIALPFADDELLAMRTGRRHEAAEASAGSRAEQLSAIEAEGWQLVASDYVTGGMSYQRDPLSFVEAGGLDTTSVVGIYLFRAV